MELKDELSRLVFRNKDVRKMEFYAPFFALGNIEEATSRSTITTYLPKVYNDELLYIMLDLVVGSVLNMIGQNHDLILNKTDLAKLDTNNLLFFNKTMETETESIEYEYNRFIHSSFILDKKLKVTHIDLDAVTVTAQNYTHNMVTFHVDFLEYDIDKIKNFYLEL